MKEKQQKNIGNRLVRLLTTRGFYLLLALGLGLVGLTGYVSNTKRQIEKINQFAQTSAPVVWPEGIASQEEARPPVGMIEEQEEEQPVRPPLSAATVATSVEPELAVAVSAPAPPRLMLPLQGEMTAEFSGDTLVYNKTMDDWRVHTGIDIRADVGTQVKAAADGVVQSAAEQGMKGFTVVIEHEGGMKTVYANLQTNNVVKQGQKVKKGEVIGGVGKDAAFEIAEPPHLHFEVLQNDVLVNPFDFMD